MMRRRNPQQRKETRDCGLCHRNDGYGYNQIVRNGVQSNNGEHDVRLEKNINENINENIEPLRVEMRVSLAEIKNAMNQMQSKLDALMARVNEAEKRISELEDGMV